MDVTQRHVVGSQFRKFRGQDRRGATGLSIQQAVRCNHAPAITTTLRRICQGSEFRSVFDHRTAPDSDVGPGHIHALAIGIVEHQESFTHATKIMTMMHRQVIQTVVIADEQYDWTLKAVELAGNPGNDLRSNATVIEQVAGDQHGVGVLCDRQIDHCLKRDLARATIITGKVTVRRVHDRRRSANVRVVAQCHDAPQ